jgi:sensor histidine kinase YesM
MKIFWKYIFPLFHGLLIYATIRLVTDTPSGDKFWERAWQINVIEVGVVMLMTFVFDVIRRRFVIKFKNKNKKFSLKNVLLEFGELMLVGFVFTNAVLYLIHYLLHDPVSLSDFVIANIVVMLYLLLHYAITRGNNFSKAIIEQQLQLEKTRTDQLQTELKFLKAQYHPHFLFNALNTIYFQMDENVAAAKKSIEKFSELLRYQLYDQQQTVSIKQEIHYLENFIALQKVRSSEKLQLRIDFDECLNGQQVYPLLFLPLVENAFKYVGGSYRLEISAGSYDNGIVFKVENSLPLEVHIKKEAGIGLENLQRRLQLLYPGRHELIVERKADSYSAALKIELN